MSLKPILDILKCLLDSSAPWEHNEDDAFAHALRKLPNYLPKYYKTKFLLHRGKWSDEGFDDLADPSIFHLWKVY